MNLLTWAVCLTMTAWGAVPASPQPKPVSVHMVALKATTEGRPQKHFEAGLESIQKEVAELKCDTFTRVASETRSAPYKQEAKLSITPKCSLYVTPLAKQTDGRIKLDIRIEAVDEKSGKSKNALRSTNVVVPGEKFKYRMKMDQAELVVIVDVSD
ncbi:MAG: hypothetical protein HZB26_00315 [Candidatus Hydrogenedentes bacterium]|nr:hypothetical protein [Candidatus Hydrogenedentota bacterium]